MVAAPVTVPAAYYHELSGAVRFWVLIDDGSIVGATINKQTLHYSLGADFAGTDALETYTANGELIDAAVRRRVAACRPVSATRTAAFIARCPPRHIRRGAMPGYAGSR
jgi:hypothetical protein